MSNEQGMKQLNLLFSESDNIYFDYKIQKEVDGKFEDRYAPCDFEGFQGLNSLINIYWLNKKPIFPG